MAENEVRLRLRGVQFDPTKLMFRLLPEDMSAPVLQLSLEQMADTLASVGVENMTWVLQQVVASFQNAERTLLEAAEDPKKQLAIGPAYVPEGDYLREVTLRAVRLDPTRYLGAPRFRLLTPIRGGLFECVSESELPSPETCEDERALRGIAREIPEGYRIHCDPNTFRMMWLKPVPIVAEVP